MTDFDDKDIAFEAANTLLCDGQELATASALMNASTLDELCVVYNAIQADLRPGETLEGRLEEAGCFFAFGKRPAPVGVAYWSYDDKRLLIERDGKYVIVDREPPQPGDGFVFDRVFG
ncbi:hypothetical protein QIH77_03330 [Bradyrhizobium diazoefficiens]|uniref:hypothetical protein n=1 Tax=Bradyrhizobium diazoefficiens TaxID=1355477 RepID=UPI00272CB437|nr:hypothetical protein [Bradyrhizobium diazoefficiens]WLA74280.1 hypothetical protein QIH77_03330 [Bradyrhizobium diazoefficiens]